MAYIGAPLVSTNFVLDQYTATAGQTAFTMTRAPASAQSVLVGIDGVVQEPGVAYTVSGTALTMTSGVPLDSKVWVVHLGVRGTTTSPADGSVGFSSLDATLAGTVVQTVIGEYTANADLTATFPFDDSIPQNTEGTEIITASITPRSATSKINVRVAGSGYTAAASDVIVFAVFRDSVADALYAGFGSEAGGTNTPSVLSGQFQDSPATASAITYKLRVGGTGGTVRLNGTVTARRFGGVAKTTLILEEIKA
jgi:hypothetical protein